MEMPAIYHEANEVARAYSSHDVEWRFESLGTTGWKRVKRGAVVNVIDEAITDF